MIKIHVLPGSACVPCAGPENNPGSRNMKKFIAIAILAAALTACTTPHHTDNVKPATLRVAPDATLNEQLIAQAQAINHAISAKFYDISAYVGKKCTLKTTFNRQAFLTEVHAEGGDPALCAAAIAAAQQATFTPFINDKVYDALKNAKLDFLP